ncbi:hypothetical protein HA402_002503 [Bradysia odoriphaga]|nr:hypothetical protein HA402_002503 [Bradysia odoriphaga]
MLLVCFFITQICVAAMGLKCDESNTRFPSPEGHCEIFYKCEDDDDGLVVPIQIQCNSICFGCHFSKEALDCVHPDEALCLPELSKLTCQKVTDLLAHPTNCSRYFTCEADLRPTVAECPTDLHFSRLLKTCVSKREARCSCDQYDNPDRPLLLPDPMNCTTFYKCHNGQPELVDCPTNLYFSLVRQRCEFPYDVDCRDGFRP